MSSEHWWNYRKERLTASKFYSAAVNTVEPNKKINSMLYTKLSTPGIIIINSLFKVGKLQVKVMYKIK